MDKTKIQEQAFTEMEQRMKFWDEYQHPSDSKKNVLHSPSTLSYPKFRLFNWLWRKKH